VVVSAAVILDAAAPAPGTSALKMPLGWWRPAASVEPLTTSCLLLSLAAAAAGADDAYAIQVRRPARVGDQFDVHLIFEETRSQRVAPVGATLPAALPAALAVSMTSTAPATSIPRAATAPATTAAASAPITHAIKADLTCRVEVTDVNYRGDISLSITVGRFTALPEGKELAPPGKVIGVQSDGLDVSLALHGGTLSDEARTVLRHVHPLEYQLDELSFGSRVPRRAGESWAVNADSVAQMDSNVQFKVDPASVKGQVTLVGAEKAGIRLTDYRGVPLRVGEMMFNDEGFGTVKGKTDELYSCLFHRRFVTPELAYSETTAYPSDKLSAANMAAKLAVSTIADVRNTMFMSGLTAFPMAHWDVLGPAMRHHAALHVQFGLAVDVVAQFSVEIAFHFWPPEEITKDRARFAQLPLLTRFPQCAPLPSKAAASSPFPPPAERGPVW